MKRAIGIAAALFLAACFRIPNPESTATAPDYGGTGKAGTVSSGGLNGTGPVLTRDATTYESSGATTASNFVPSAGTEAASSADTSTVTAPPFFTEGLLGNTWDSGSQQCQVGDHKINYRFWLTRALAGPNIFAWTVHYDVWVEDKRAVGSGWRRVNQLAYIHGSFGHGGTPIIGHHAVPHQAAADGELATGTNPNGLTEVSIRVERFGGSSGIHVIWPGDGCHES